jgi:hypothetical protein
MDLQFYFYDLSYFGINYDQTNKTLQKQQKLII